MEWIAITDVIPSRPTEVLLVCKANGISVFSLGELGGCKNRPEIIVHFVGEEKRSVYATHWCRLKGPPNEP